VFEVVAALSAPSLGAQRNDDALGYVVENGALYAWVIDGSTSVADEDYIDPEYGDVAWFSRALSRTLIEHVSDDLPLGELHALAAASVMIEYQHALLRVPARPPLFAQPTAAISIVRIRSDSLELFELGDCSAFAWNGRDATRLGSGVGQEHNRKTRARVAVLQAAHGASPKTVWQQDRIWERTRRDARLRQPRLNVSTPSAEDRFDGWSTSIGLESVDAVVLMSDGLERFAVEFEMGNETEMVRRILSDGPESLLRDVRAIETADADCRRFPRVKTSDDASCVVAQKVSLGRISVCRN
jgi:hypothetical protein